MDSFATFEDLPLPLPVKTALSVNAITIPTDIQAGVIPHAMQGKDVIGLAQTGTGKTLAFCLPLITMLDKEENQEATALILAPTREIAIQVMEVIKGLTAKMTGRWSPVLVIGGVGMQHQIDGLQRKPRMIVSTPGRLVDHMREGVAHLDNVKFLVLDEADRMLDMGFAPQLNEILAGLPKERQTMLFSATFPKEIEEISRDYLSHPQRVEVGDGHSKPVASVTQVVKELEEGEKFAALLEALNEREGTIIVFVRTKHRTERLAKQLEKNGHSTGRIHGDRSQTQRQGTLGAFREGKIRVLVATDIAARGIDVPNVAHVINYDIPNVPEEYIHRIGRTGRAGALGDALSFVTPEVREEWRAILKLIDPELYAQTPHVPNVPRPERPQQQSRGPQQPRGEGGGRDRNRGGGRGPQRGQNRGQGGGQRPRRDYPQEQQPHYDQQASMPAREREDGDEDFFPQPTLEEQFTRIDREARGGNRGGNRGGGQNRGGQNRGGQNRGGPPNRGGQGRNNNRRPEARHPYARPGAHNQQSQQNQNFSEKPAADMADDSDDNIGNRAGGDDKKKGFWDFFKK